MTKFIEDPRLFSFIILGLYTCNVLRWVFARNLGQAVYWAAAFMITFSVTFLMGGAK
jgi:hypothetical protein